MIFAAQPGTAVFHAFEKGWTTGDYLAANMVDALAMSLWMKTEDAQQRFPRHRPKPVPRPTWDEDAGSRVGQVVELGVGSATVTTVGEFMARREARQAAWLERHGKRKGG